MKKIVLAIFALITVGILLFPSCSKKIDNPPAINLEEPIEGSSYSLTDSVHIEGTATDDNDLHTFTLIVTYMGDTVFSDFPYVHGTKTYPFHYHFNPGSAGPYHLTLMVEDHADHSAVVEKDFSITP